LTASADDGEEVPAAAQAPEELPTPLPKRYGVNADQIERLKQSVNIISVIESYGLEQFERKSSTRATACCPFHTDKSPSLQIDADRGIYKCFGCGVGGNVFSFVKAYCKLQGEDVTYYQAIRRVQNEWGDRSLQIFPEHLTTDEAVLDAIRLRKERIMLANAAAAAFYNECLTKPSSGFARNYVRSRGITPRTAKEFCLGYAPDAYSHIVRGDGTWGYGSLVQHLRALGFNALEILDAGLAVRINARAKSMPFQSVEANAVYDNSPGRSFQTVLSIVPFPAACILHSLSTSLSPSAFVS
jgi:DNA primase catalytic core